MQVILPTKLYTYLYCTYVHMYILMYQIWNQYYSQSRHGFLCSSDVQYDENCKKCLNVFLQPRHLIFISRSNSTTHTV